MGELAQRIAVITGAASGMGEAMAERAVAEGMQVVLVDVETLALAHVAERLRDGGSSVWAMEADVSDRAAMLDLAAKVESEVGETWLLVNNAGAGSGARVHETTHELWEFTLGVNLWGVIHGLEAFLPKMVERDRGHVVNTASMAGLVTTPRMAAYVASKHAVVGLTEVLYRDLEEMGSAVGVSLLCPGAVTTNILDSLRNWPGRLGMPPSHEHREYPAFPGLKQPKEVADQVFEAIGKRQFWVLTHPWQYAEAIRARFDGAVAARNPDDSTVDPVVGTRARRGRS
ncbi:MAG: SDR family NAD(P)-dependent oxidoreductase [Actinomycetota bacterium]|jgi:NAD(P)-dependent dehydrogenase (short-subunit alcohol dehydrogenase family)|nr:SDR family NAD(P)-dependent oxidoreductase [Actinomycetota bacterium]